jgi:RNA recognition motif-containing protein
LPERSLNGPAANKHGWSVALRAGSDWAGLTGGNNLGKRPVPDPCRRRKNVEGCIWATRPHLKIIGKRQTELITTLMTTIYIGNLPNDTTAERAKRLFSNYGEVQSIHLTPSESTRRYQGYGFVEMDEGVARRAIAELDGSVYCGAILCVNEATSAQLAQQEEIIRPDTAPAAEDNVPPSNILRRYYQVVSVEKASGPGGSLSDDWYRYELQSGPSSITGFHRGTRDEVTEYATECAAAFNLRSMKGKSARTTARPKKR